MTTAPSARPCRSWLLAPFLVFILVALPAGAEPNLEAQTREIASGLRCPVCQNLSVADSPSDMAREMRGLILDQLRAGKRPEEIHAYFVSKYGEWILLSPPSRGIGLFAWLLPALGAVAGLGGAAWALRSWTRRGMSASEPVDAALLSRIRAAVAADDLPVSLAPEEARLVEALRELEFDYRAGKLSARDYEELSALYEARAAQAMAASKQRAQAPAREVGVSAPAASARRGPAVRVWRWAAAALFLVTFGTAIGYFLPRSVRERGEGSITGDFLTGSAREPTRPAPRDLPTLLAQGQQAMEAQDFRGAMDLFTRALELDPDQPAANAYFGLILHRAGHSDRALKAFDRALARDPVSSPALWGKGLVLYESLGKTADAVKTWEMLLAQDLAKEDREHLLSILTEARERLAGQMAPARESRR